MKKQIDINVKWEDDVDPDLSWLGEYKGNRPDTLYVDRANDVLINPNIEIVKKFSDESEYNDYRDSLDEKEIPFIDYDYLDADNNAVYELYHPYWEDLSFSCHFERHDFQFIESMNYQESTTKEDYGYFMNDVKRLEKYGRSWNMMGCIVTASVDGIELGGASLRGLESDMSDADKQEVIDDLTSEATEEAKKKLAKWVASNR